MLLDAGLPELEAKTTELREAMSTAGVEVITEPSDETWNEEFLAMRIVVGAVDGLEAAVAKTNQHSGGHSATIMAQDEGAARAFMEGVDCAAVYHNASTRFTDGGEMGVGAELAISTDKLHHRGPLGLAQLVTNKYWVFGVGQVR